MTCTAANMRPSAIRCATGLFVSFFPQMVQGPISRFDQLAPQLTAERKLCWDDLQIGIQLALWGYFKKNRHRRPRGCSGKQRHHGELSVRRCCHCARYSILLHSAVLRFFRRHRHHTRRRAHVRHRYDAQLPPTAVFHLAHRLLAPLAHHTRCVDARLCVLSSGVFQAVRQARQVGAQAFSRA